MISIYRLVTNKRRSHFSAHRFEYQYVKEKLCFFTFCPIKDKFIVMGFRWAGNSPFGYEDKQKTLQWGYRSLCRQQEEFILIGKNPGLPY